MPDATSPDNIWFLNASDNAPGPHTLTAQLAGSVQAALNYRQISTFRWATIAEKDAEVDMDYGSIGYCEENGYLYVYDVFTDEWVALNGAPVVGRGYRTTDISVSSSSSGSTSPLDTFSLSGGMTSGANSLVIPEDGWYTVIAQVAWSASSSGNRRLAIYVNGVNVSISDLRPGLSGNTLVQSNSGILELSSGDDITVNRWQSSGGSLIESSAYLSVAKVR